MAAEMRPRNAWEADLEPASPPSNGTDLEKVALPNQPALTKKELREHLRAMCCSASSWPAAQWLTLRQRIWDAGCLGLLPVLLEGVERSTQDTLRNSFYRLDNRRVALRLARPAPRWVGQLDKQDHKPSASQGPELRPALRFESWGALEAVASLAAELDAKSAGSDHRPHAGQLRGGAGGQRIALCVEFTQFTQDGLKFDVKPSVTSAEASLQLCTDFRIHAAGAVQGLERGGGLRDHLAASEDPYALLCRGVTAFRGEAVDGFQFLHEPLEMDVVVTARPAGGPQHHGLGDRWDLAALALAGNESIVKAGCKEVEGVELPALVLALRPGADATGALVTELQRWRRQHANRFSVVIVACGRGAAGEELARELAEGVNDDVTPSRPSTAASWYSTNSSSRRGSKVIADDGRVVGRPADRRSIKSRLAVAIEAAIAQEECASTESSCMKSLHSPSMTASTSASPRFGTLSSTRSRAGSTPRYGETPRSTDSPTCSDSRPASRASRSPPLSQFSLASLGEESLFTRLAVQRRRKVEDGLNLSRAVGCAELEAPHTRHSGRTGTPDAAVMARTSGPKKSKLSSFQIDVKKATYQMLVEPRGSKASTFFAETLCDIEESQATQVLRPVRGPESNNLRRPTPRRQGLGVHAWPDTGGPFKDAKSSTCSQPIV